LRSAKLTVWPLAALKSMSVRTTPSIITLRSLALCWSAWAMTYCPSSVP